MSRYIKGAALALAGFLLGQLSMIPDPTFEASKPAPVWIGHDCDGAGGDLWAMDLSDFPTACKDLERY